MNASPRQDDATTQTSPVTDRYAAVSTDDGDIVVFDAEEADAWIQSNTAICVTALR